MFIATTTKKAFVMRVRDHASLGVLKQRKADNAHQASEVVSLLEVTRACFP